MPVLPFHLFSAVSDLPPKHARLFRQPSPLSPRSSSTDALPTISAELRWTAVRILICLSIFLFFLSLTLVAILADDSDADPDPDSHINVNVSLEARNEGGNSFREREAERVNDLMALMRSRTFRHRLTPSDGGVVGEVDAHRTREMERRFRREEEEGESALLAAVRLSSVREEEEEEEEGERSPLRRGYGWQERRGYGYGAIGAMRTFYGVQIRSG